MDYEEQYFEKTGKYFFKVGIERKQQRFAKEQGDLTWLSWNYPDWKVNRYLKKVKE